MRRSSVRFREWASFLWFFCIFFFSRQLENGTEDRERGWDSVVKWEGASLGLGEGANVFFGVMHVTAYLFLSLQAIGLLLFLFLIPPGKLLLYKSTPLLCSIE